MRRERVAMLIKKTAVVVEKQANAALASYELTSTQFRILMFLNVKGDAPVRQIDIENTFALTNPTVTGILHNLEKKGLVMRCENPEDKRSKLIALTDRAQAIIPELDILGAEIDARVTRNLSSQEREQLAQLLKKMLNDNTEASDASMRNAKGDRT